MNNIDSVKTLIDLAARRAGSDYKLAKLLGETRQRISNWKNGSAACSPADQALLADIAGLDPVVVLARATVEKYEGRAKGDALMKALGKVLLVTGAAIGSAGASAHPIYSRIIDAMRIRQKGFCKAPLRPSMGF